MKNKDAYDAITEIFYLLESVTLDLRKKDQYINDLEAENQNLADQIMDLEIEKDEMGKETFGEYA